MRYVIIVYDFPKNQFPFGEILRQTRYFFEFLLVYLGKPVQNYPIFMHRYLHKNPYALHLFGEKPAKSEKKCRPGCMGVPPLGAWV